MIYNNIIENSNCDRLMDEGYLDRAINSNVSKNIIFLISYNIDTIEATTEKEDSLYILLNGNYCCSCNIFHIYKLCHVNVRYFSNKMGYEKITKNKKYYFCKDCECSRSYEIYENINKDIYQYIEDHEKTL